MNLTLWANFQITFPLMKSNGVPLLDVLHKKFKVKLQSMSMSWY